MALNLDWKYENTTKAGDVHGICMTTSAHWAKSSARKGQKLGSLGVNVLAAGAMHVVRSKEHKIVDAGGGSFDTRVDAWHQGFFERLGVTGKVENKGIGTNWDITSASGIYVLTIYGAGGHTMAFARFNSFSVFFDPNYGQMSCAASIFSSFKADVKAHLKKEYADLLQNWYVYRVTL
jgi:hypothetical protein